MPEAIGKLPTFQEALMASEQRGVRHTLIRQLQRKFTTVPESVKQQIEATSDIEQLDKWLDQTISAPKLTEIEKIFQA
ncbi:MAG: hypothetical protein ABFS56_16415 [Pseudomonadota bacterium]